MATNATKKGVKIGGRKLKCRLIEVDANSKPEDVFGVAMNQMKEEGYTKCQFATIFDTPNNVNKYRSGTFIDLKRSNPQVSMWRNVVGGEYVDEEYWEHVNASVSEYSVKYC